MCRSAVRPQFWGDAKARINCSQDAGHRAGHQGPGKAIQGSGRQSCGVHRNPPDRRADFGSDSRGRGGHQFSPRPGLCCNDRPSGDALCLAQAAVLNLALDAGYASPEAFSHSFRPEFELVPTARQHRGVLAGLTLTSSIPMRAMMANILTEPKIEVMPKRIFAGVSKRYPWKPVARSRSNRRPVTTTASRRLGPGRATTAFPETLSKNAGLTTTWAKRLPAKPNCP